MSMEEEDEFWNSSNVKAFNFDDEAQTTQASSGIKTLDSILAARPNQPFLKPSMIVCSPGRVEELLDYLDETFPAIETPRPKQDPKSLIGDIVRRRAPIDFSPYRSKKEKLILLDSAIRYSDGNTITAVSIFISKTLKSSIFIEEMKKRPIAMDHYINYLEISGKFQEATAMRKI